MTLDALTFGVEANSDEALFQFKSFFQFRSWKFYDRCKQHRQKLIEKKE